MQNAESRVQSGFLRALRSDLCTLHLIDWGLKNRDLSGVTKIGVDEIQRSKGHKYMTLVYQLDEDNKRLLDIEEGREEKSLNQFFDTLNKDSPEDEPRTDNIEFVCSDMWKPYLKVVEQRCPNALNILDKFCRRQTGKHCTSKDI